jgi:glutamate-1-semialdehyde 2,1-aminomutase
MSNTVFNEGYYNNQKLFFSKGLNDYIFTKKNKFIDLSFCSGANLLGHNTDVEKKIFKKYSKNNISNFSSPNIHADQLSKIILKILPSFSKIIFCNSGSEANIKALRICRAITKKDKVASVTGCWHGSVDQFLFKTSSKLEKSRLSDGLTDEIQENIIFIPYNDIEYSKKILDKNKNKISSIFIEPIQGCLPNNNQNNYLKFLETYCKNNNIFLVFDEMITGVRTNLGSAQKFFGIKTDISTFGKAFGNGVPIGFIAVTNKIENLIKNKKLKIYFGGTFSGNSLTSFLAKEYLIYLIKNKKKIFSYLEKVSILFQEEINNYCKKYKFFRTI